MIKIPAHVAIIMDGNGRWAKQRLLPRFAGHQQGLNSVRTAITFCAKKHIPCLTLFAFSSENWRRPETEVNFLLGLFLRSLKSELKTLAENKVCLKIIGDKSSFSEELKTAILEAEKITENNTGMRLNIAFNYGGHWDIIQATKKITEEVTEGKLKTQDISEEIFRSHLTLNDCPDPDLLIRTSGEYRISNFLLWQFAYTELYFTDCFWPDFREEQFEEALKVYNKRKRRFGYIGEQIEQSPPDFAIIEQKIHA